MNVVVENIDTEKKIINKNTIDITPSERKSVWQKRLILFLKAEYSFKKVQLIYTLCIAMFFLSIGFLIFTLNRPHIIPAWFFMTAISILTCSILISFIVYPLVKASKNHRNRLSQRFYENEFYVEFTQHQVLLISRANAQLICQINRYQ
jgi:hypothetical protein